jgi:hypothetical protein
VLWGIVILIVIVSGGFIPPFTLTGPGRVVASLVVGGLLVLGVALVALPPRTRPDRLFHFDGGVVLISRRAPEPLVLRWADLTSVTRNMGDSDGIPYLRECVLGDCAGRVLTLSSAFAGLEEVATEAVGALARRKAAALLAELGDPGSQIFDAYPS